MMKFYYTFFLIIFLLQFSCDKDNDENKVPEWSRVTALKNGNYWETGTVARNILSENNTKVYIQANIFNEYGYWREALNFDNVNLKVGQQILYRRIPNSDIDSLYSRYTTFMADGDVVEDRFVVYESEDNYIDIQLLDLDKMEMSGIFQVTFIRDENDPITNPELPDTIRFTEGEFHLKIIDKD